MNLKQIIEEYKKLSREVRNDREAVSQFISTSITKLLEELRIDEEKVGYNLTTSEINSKIDKILNK